MTKEKDTLEEGLDHALIAGYLDVKLPGRTRRRRFGPWKSWRRHWVQARLLPDAAQDAPAEAVELVLSPARLGLETAVIRVPAGPGSRASVCRTASRSRCHAFVIAAPAEQAEHAEVFLATRSDADTERWMAVLRVAIAGRQPLPTSPRGLSAASAALLRGRRLSRSEGDLLAAPLGALALGLPPGPPPSEDSLDSPSLGAGLRVPSPAELRSLRARGASANTDGAKTSTLPRPSTSQSATQTRQPFRLLYGRRRAETLNAQTCPDKDRLSPTQSHSGSALSLLGGKIASGLISAGLGLILSTPGGSEAEDDDADDGADVLPAADLSSIAAAESSEAALDRRRESAVSVASGIYEEISECGAALAAEAVYENAAAALCRRASNGLENHYEDLTLLRTPPPNRGPAEGLPDDGRLCTASPRVAAPPPLPPRQNLTPISELLTRARAPDGGVDADGYVQMGLVRSMVKSAAAKANPPFEFLRAAKCASGTALASDAEPTYLPMSPIRPPGFEKNRAD